MADSRAGFYAGTTGVDDDDLLVDFVNAEAHDVFMLMSTAGAMDVFVSLDGTNFSTAGLSLTDMGATTTDPVVVTAANRIYGFRGKYARIQVRQNGATAVTAPVLAYGTM